MRPPTAPGGAFVLTRVYPRIRTYGADFAVPTSLAHVERRRPRTSCRRGAPSTTTLSTSLKSSGRSGQWLLTGGYAGEIVKSDEAPLAFDPERSLARSIIARAPVHRRSAAHHHDRGLGPAERRWRLSQRRVLAGHRRILETHASRRSCWPETKTTSSASTSGTRTSRRHCGSASNRP